MTSEKPDNHDDVPPGEEDVRDRGVPREDKIAFTLAVVIFCIIGLGGILAVDWVLDLVGIALAAGDDGVGFRGAFIASIVISFIITSLFALVSGDGAVGELGFVIVGFFVMVVFFTFSIAIVL